MNLNFLKLKKSSSAGSVKMGVDAVDQVGSRSGPRPSMRLNPDQNLPPYKRELLSATSWESLTNIANVGWAVRLRVNYTTDYLLSVDTGDEVLDNTILKWWKWRTSSEQIHAGKRHSLGALMRLMEMSCILDGDALLYKRADGKLSLINGCRIAAAGGALPAEISEEIHAGNLIDLQNGVIINLDGAPIFYHVKSWDGHDFKSSEILSADDVIADGYFTDGDTQTRGITPLTPSLNLYRDMYQVNNYMMSKIRIQAMLGLYVKENPNSAFASGFTDRDPQKDPDDIDRRDRELLKMSDDGGTYIYRGEPGEEIDTVQVNNPTQEYQAWNEKVTMSALQGMDIPYSFCDPSKFGHPAIKTDIQRFMASMREIMVRKRAILDHLLEWLMIYDSFSGVLELPDSGIESVISSASWIEQPSPWLDELQSITAAEKSVSVGIGNRNAWSQRLFRRTFRDNIRQLAAEEKIIKETGVQVVSGQPGQEKIPIAADPAWVSAPDGGASTETGESR